MILLYFPKSSGIYTNHKYIKEMTKDNDQDGSSEWVKPIMKGYNMVCCDCGLAHTLDFYVTKREKLIKKFKDGNHKYKYSIIDDPKYEVALRIKRNNRSTGQYRRHSNISVKHEYEDD